MPPPVLVNFYHGDPNAGGILLGTEYTTLTLHLAEAEIVELTLDDPPFNIKTGKDKIYVVVDEVDQATRDNRAWHECRTDNNTDDGYGRCFGAAG